MAWLDANQADLAVPIRLGRRTRSSWHMRFGGISVNVNASLIAVGEQNELVVAAEWQGECWDLLASFEASPAVRESGRPVLLTGCHSWRGE
jgi:hypothetical protein